MTERKLQRNRRGFTLTEGLLALAILIILLALAMIPISRHQRNIRQSELDSKAETIYLAAQNRLSQLQASGRSDEYGKDRATALNNIPWDAEQDKYTTSTLYYVTSAAKSTDTSAAGSILPREQVEAELWDANWVIEYDPGSGSVYAVFYSEKPMQYSFDAFNPLRSRDRRVQEGATVGYYGGDSVQSEDTGKLTPKMEIINKERLLLKVTCDTPRDPLHFYVTVTDAQGHSTGRMELTGSEVNVSYRTYTVTMVLDDLTEGKRFSQQRRFRQLTPGSDLTLKVEVESDSRLVDSVTGKLTTNSLFAEVRDSGTTAVVTYARHLQNLDEGSGLPTAKLDEVVGVVKAYSSCVGEGPFVCEWFGADAEKLRDAGDEYGAKTGRPRRVGPIDLVATRYGVRTQNATNIALTKLDILSYMDRIPVCAHYEINGQRTDEFPFPVLLDQAKPVVEYVPGWACDISAARTWEDLPQAARDYVEYVERAIGCHIGYVSVGAERDSLIVR